ncbi:SCO1860 family LAETG-anchored protein [Streptomyces sp. NRRL F-5126]|uniref:SCO1860 family LAETG-anchored protein n=1 Tax=Streptomyces sp. NRRL F-5126 TaxID=1463857 RepID=UPI0004C5ECF0|nr:SCO1860 family LAETG-anchored protein [Streptomyces sp. NRRL F-5126]
MNSDTFRRTSARRLAAATAAAALAAGPVLLAAPAQATGVEEHGGGAAHAAVLKAGLDVSLLDKTVDVPVNTSLNEVRAPQSADKKALSLTVDGVNKGRPFSMVSADVADAKATVAGGKAEGYVNIVNAKVHVPGLRGLSLIALRQVTAKATCEAGKHPVASANLLGDVTVLGKTVSLSTGGPTKVSVPDVGDVSLELSQTHTTSRTAAATALALDVSVNPLKLNVADVKGSVKLATADCTAPKPSGGHHGGGTPSKPTAPASGEPSGAAPSAPDVRAQSATEPKPAKSSAQDLAETGSSSTTPYIAGGAAILLLAGAGAVVLAKRRASH